MSLFETIFGASSHNQGYQDAFDSRAQGLANQATNTAYNQYGQSQLAQSQLAQQQYNQALLGQYHIYKDKPKWVYNGCECTLKEFTELMWPDDEQARLMFILKHGGV